MRVDLKNSIYQKVWNSKSLRERYTERYKNVLREEIKRNLDNTEQKSDLENEVKENMRKEVDDSAWLWRMKYEEEVKQTIKKENVDNEEALRKEMREKEKKLVAELEAAINEKEKALTTELEAALKEKERKMKRDLEATMNKRVVNDMHLKEEQIRREQQLEIKLRVAAEMKEVEEKMKMERMEEVRQEVENSAMSLTESLKAQKEKELKEKTVSMEEQRHLVDESMRLEIMKECEDSLRQDIEAQLLVDEAFIAKIKEEVRERVKRNMMDTESGAIRDDIAPEVEDEIRLELLHEMRKDEALMCKLRQEMEDYLRKEIRNNESLQVTDSLVQSQGELKQSIYNEIDVQALRLEIRNELYADISEKEETGMREDIRNELIEKLKREIEKEESLTQQIHKRLQDQAEKDIRSKESDQIEAEVRRGLERQYKAKYEADMMKSIQEEVSGAREKRFRELEEEMELSLDQEMNDRKEKLKYEIEMEFRSEIEKETADKEDDIKEDILNRMKKEIREEIEKERQTLKDQMFKHEMEEYNARLDADLKDMQRELYDEKSVLVEQQVDEEVRQLMEEYKYIKEEELDQWKEDYENARMAEIKEKVDEDLVDIEGKLKDAGETEIKAKLDKYMKTYEEKQKKKIENTIDKKYANAATKEGKGTSNNKQEKGKTTNEAVNQSDNTSDEIDSIVSSGSDSEGSKKGQKKKKSFLKPRSTERKEEGVHKPNGALGSEGRKPAPIQQFVQDPMTLAPATVQGTSNADAEKKQHVPPPAPTGRPLGGIKKGELEAPPVLLNRRQKMADPAPLHKPNHTPVPAQKATQVKGSSLPVSVDPRGKAADQSKGKPSTVTYTHPHPYGSPRELPADVACEYVDADGNPVDPRMMMNYGYGYPEPPPGVEFEYVDQYGRPVNPQDMAAPGYGYANEPPPDDLAPNRDDSHGQGMYSSRQKKLMAEKEMFGPTEPKSTIPTQSVQAPNKTMLPKSGALGAFDAALLPSTRNMGPSNKALVPLEEPLPSKQKKKKKKKKEKSSLSDDIDKVLDMPPIGRRGIDFDPLGMAGKDSVKVPDASPLNKRGAAFDPLGLATKAATDKPTQQENNNRPRDAIDILASRFGPSNNTLAPLQGPEFGSKGGPLASIGTTRNGSTKPPPPNMQNTNDNTPNADKTKGVSFNLREYNLHWNEPKEWVDKSPEKSILKMDENTIINVDPTQLYEDSSVLTSDEGSKQNGKVVRIGDNDKETYYSSESDYGAPDIDLDDDDVAVMFRKKDNMDDDFNANARRVAYGRRFGRRQMAALTNARNGKVP